MAFQTPVTIKYALDKIYRRDYVLPAIQREFVWKPSQICRLFDSLMQGYPIGSFLFWKVSRQNRERFTFYDFVREYHERDAPHCPPLGPPGEQEVTAVLDGQQRLTALNIGLRGTHAAKEPKKRRDNDAAYPRKKLYLNLLGQEEFAQAQDDGEGMCYEFAFRSEEEALARDERQFWFPVHQAMDMRAGPAVHRYLLQHDLATNEFAFALVDQLREIVQQKLLINYYLEEEQENLNKVLNIFIRVNSGGTVLAIPTSC